MSILSAKDIHVTFWKPGGAPAHAVRGASLSIGAGEIVGILGESGSGKSTLARALVGGSLKQTTCSGTIRLQHQPAWNCETSSKTSRLRAGLRGVSFVSQHPSLVLNPFQRVRTQLTELLSANGLRRRCRQERVFELVSAVRLKDPSKVVTRYPHQLSGGEKQRVAIALALAAAPKVLVCDEATSSVDPATEAELLAMFLSLRESFGLAIVWITHNPSQLRSFADRIAVMYAGRIVESGSTAQVLDAPLHPYTAALIRCSNRSSLLSEGAHRQRLDSIPGGAPDAAAMFNGCSFAERCSDRRQSCDQTRPRTVETVGSREVECVLYEQ
jgi:oligopeptide/dipeptide ABC transporter ATP-binding protein